MIIAVTKSHSEISNPAMVAEINQAIIDFQVRAHYYKGRDFDFRHPVIVIDSDLKTRHQHAINLKCSLDLYNGIRITTVATEYFTLQVVTCMTAERMLSRLGMDVELWRIPYSASDACISSLQIDKLITSYKKGTNFFQAILDQRGIVSARPGTSEFSLIF